MFPGYRASLSKFSLSPENFFLSLIAACAVSAAEDELFIKVQEIRVIHLKFFLLKVGLLLVKSNLNKL